MRQIKKFLTYPPYRPIVFLLAAVLCLMPIAAFAAPALQDLPPDPETAPVTEVIVYLVTFLVGFLGSSLSQFLKNKLGIELKWALLLTYGISLVLAVVQLFILGWFDPTLFTAENLPVIFTTLFTSATFWYQFFIKPREEAQG